MTIYLIANVYNRASDYGDYDVVELELDESNEGWSTDYPYFTTREAAEAWVDARQGDADLKYEEALAQHEIALKSYAIRLASATADWVKLKQLADDNNLPFSQSRPYLHRPAKPLRHNFGVRYQIVRAECGDPE